MTSRRVGILGGTFDPIHRGHRDVALGARAAVRLTEIHVIPSSVPPHRPQPVASGYHRFAMVALAIAEHPQWYVSDMELQSPAPSYTAATLGRFHARGYRAEELFFIIGADAFADIETWMDYPALLDLASFVVVSRPGCPVRDLPLRLPRLASRMNDAATETSEASILLIDTSTADVSATAIRERLAAGEPIQGLVAPGVRQHIERHDLYGFTTGARRDQNTPDTETAGRMHGQD